MSMLKLYCKISIRKTTLQFRRRHYILEDDITFKKTIFYLEDEEVFLMFVFLIHLFLLYPTNATGLTISSVGNHHQCRQKDVVPVQVSGLCSLVVYSVFPVLLARPT